MKMQHCHLFQICTVMLFRRKPHAVSSRYLSYNHQVLVISNRQIFKFSKMKNLCSLSFRRPNSVGAFRLFPATGRIFTKAAAEHITLTKDRTALYEWTGATQDAVRTGSVQSRTCELAVTIHILLAACCSDIRNRHNMLSTLMRPTSVIARVYVRYIPTASHCVACCLGNHHTQLLGTHSSKAMRGLNQERLSSASRSIKIRVRISAWKLVIIPYFSEFSSVHS